jgi:hypothetical protein
MTTSRIHRHDRDRLRRRREALPGECEEELVGEATKLADVLAAVRAPYDA